MNRTEFLGNFQNQHGNDFPCNLDNCFPIAESHGCDMDAPRYVPSGSVKRQTKRIFGSFPGKEYTNKFSVYIFIR